MENACVSPIYRHSLSESQSVAYKGKNAPGAPRTQPGELCWDFPAPEAVNRGPAERDTPGFPPPPVQLRICGPASGWRECFGLCLWNDANGGEEPQNIAPFSTRAKYLCETINVNLCNFWKRDGCENALVSEICVIFLMFEPQFWFWSNKEQKAAT